MREQKKKYILDSYAMISYLYREKGYDKVIDILADQYNEIYMNILNIGEIYYIIAKRNSKRAADLALHVIESLPVNVVSPTKQLVIEAARIKAKYPLSYADAFVVATAKMLGGIILTGDPEFKPFDKFVEWI